jgi:hypothetical protein
MYCCQACLPMNCLAMYALLLRILCCDMCLPVCYLAMDALLLLDGRWLEHVYLAAPYQRIYLLQYFLRKWSVKYYIAVGFLVF